MSHTCRDDGSHLLYDGCARCDEHASSPFHDLDSRHLLGLYDIGIQSEKGGAIGGFSYNELIASGHIMRTMHQASRIEKLRMNREAVEGGRM